MKYTIALEHMPDGHCIDNPDAGENASFVSSAFITDENGDIFYKILQGSTDLFLKNFLDTGAPVSIIDRFLILIKNNEATIYINDFDFEVETIVQRAVNINEEVMFNDMMGIRRLSFRNISITDDMGIVFFFSVGWRRGLFFDYRSNAGAKLENIHQILGGYFESLLYNDLYNISDNLLEAIFDLGWFPFLSLIGQRQSKFERFVSRIREGKTTEFAEAELIESFGEAELKVIGERLKQNALLQPHISILEAGIERYQNQDYISCINNIWPRVEGILRYNFSKASKERINPLLNNMEAGLDPNIVSYPGIFFPKKFKDYLKLYYFRDFDLANGQLEVSRNSIGHGVSNQEDYDRKRALLGILIADQLGYYIKLIPKPSP